MSSHLQEEMSTKHTHDCVQLRGKVRMSQIQNLTSNTDSLTQSLTFSSPKDLLITTDPLGSLFSICVLVKIELC